MWEKVRTALNFIEETKKEVREKERKDQIIAKFEELFGFEPERIEWKREYGINFYLEASACLEIDNDGSEWTILGQEVRKVLFTVREEIDEKNSINWDFDDFSRGIYNVFRWKRRAGKFFAKVEILVK